MPQTLRALSDLAALPFDDIIDVRSPSEYAEDHIPGAISLPVLSDAERAEVGTIYVQQDRFLARKIGAALVARNASTHLQGPLADRDGSWRPLVYCWRGGQRSGSFAAIMAQIGWRVDTIEGGYKSYRSLVVREVYETPMATPVVLIDGGTGTAKTRVLDYLAAQGAQVLDLEAMAEHRGSVFGPMGGAQPSQKAFETRLAMAMSALDASAPVYIEAESSRIGSRNLPPALWKAMIAAPRVRLSAPLDARAGHLVATYGDLIADLDALDAVLVKLVRFHGHAQVDAWKAQARSGDFHGLAKALVLAHYDPRYTRISRDEAVLLGELDLPDLTDETLAAAAARIMAM